MTDRNLGHIGINSWLSLNELEEIVKVIRHLGSESQRPGQILRQYIQASIPLLQKLLDIKPSTHSTADTIKYLKRTGIVSSQLSETKLNTNIVKAMVGESMDDANFKGWKTTVVVDKSDDELEQLLNEQMKKLDK